MIQKPLKIDFKLSLLLRESFCFNELLSDKQLLFPFLFFSLYFGWSNEYESAKIRSMPHLQRTFIFNLNFPRFLLLKYLNMNSCLIQLLLCMSFRSSDQPISCIQSTVETETCESYVWLFAMYTYFSLYLVLTLTVNSSKI